MNGDVGMYLAIWWEWDVLADTSKMVHIMSCIFRHCTWKSEAVWCRNYGILTNQSNCGLFHKRWQTCCLPLSTWLMGCYINARIYTFQFTLNTLEYKCVNGWRLLNLKCMSTSSLQQESIDPLISGWTSVTDYNMNK